MISHILKRIMDLVMASMGLLATIPVILVVAAFLQAKMGRPLIYRSTRAGKGGEPFTMYKFRTMTNETDSDGTLLPDERRITRLGNFLRSTSIDELPTLVNVLKGDMSVVGPRPLPMRYVARYSPRQALRLRLRPGLTGWAVVRGRNSLSWDEKFEADAWYVENHSLWLDIKIIFKTIGLVLRREGISQEGHATMEEFRGEA